MIKKRLFIITLCVSLLGCAWAQQDTARVTKTAKICKKERKQVAKKVEPITLSQEEFAKMVFDYNDTSSVYKGKLPAIVDFYADWCGPCKRLAPILHELLEENEGKLLVYKVNIDHNKEIARAIQVRNIPTLLFLKKDEQPKRAVGLLTKEQLQEIITTHLWMNKSNK